MSLLLRSLLVACVTSLLLVACGEKATETTEEPSAVANPAIETPVAAEPAAEAAPATTSGGGYEPTAEERVPGITLDAAAPANEAAPAAPATN